MLRLTGQVLFLGWPLFVAALLHGLVLKHDWLPRLKRPLDLGLTFRGGPIFGAHKTFRGFLVNLAGCLGGAALQGLLAREGSIPDWLALTDYGRHWLILGLLLGLGMTLGELPNSFLKRRLAIPPGGSGQGAWAALFFVLDQIDLAGGIWVLTYWLLRPSPALLAWSFGLTLILHLAVSTSGYLLKMRATPA